MKRILTLTSLALVAAVAIGLLSQTRAAPAASARAAVDIPVLRVGLIGSAGTLDPARLLGDPANTMRALGFEGLVTIGADGVIRPHLARQVRHPNPNTYIYDLRRGVRFWDGSEMTAVDVANSLNYFRHKEFQSSFYFQNVRNIKATARYTVKVELKRPDVTWKYTPVVLSQIFQKKHADAHAGEWGNPGVMPMATGPWRFVSLNPTRGLELVANDRYWGGRPSIRRISVRFFSDETSAAVAFRAGEIDVAFPQDARAFASTSGAKVDGYPGCGIGIVSMNVNQPPWSDIRVRRAIAHLVDRAGIARALGGYVTPVDQLIPRQMWKGIAPARDVERLYGSLPKYEFSLAKARQELARSRVPNGFSATLNVPTAFPSIGVYSQVLAANAQKIGIKLELRNMPVGQWISQYYGPRDQLGIFPAGSGCAAPDPSWYPGVFLTSKNARVGGTNLADYKNARVDALIEAGAGTENPAKRLRAYGELLRIVQRDLPYLVLYVEHFRSALNRRLAWPGRHFLTVGQSRPWALDIRAR